MQVATGDLAAIAALVGKQPDAFCALTMRISFTALFRITSATETVSTFAFFSDVGPIAIGPTALSGG